MLPENYQELLKELLKKNWRLVLVFLVGLVLVSFGAVLVKKSIDLSPTKIEVLEATTTSDSGQKIVVEVSGQVEKPGVYELPKDSRIEDALIIAGGLSEGANRDWVEKTINRAAKLSDGQKLYIPAVNEQSTSTSDKNSAIYQTTSASLDSQGSGLVNINTGTVKDLDSLPGIGQVYAQSIIEHRPYSTPEELVSKGAIKSSIYEKIKDKIIAY